MRKIRKMLHVRARKNSAGGKFQSEMETIGVLGTSGGTSGVIPQEECEI